MKFLAFLIKLLLLSTASIAQKQKLREGIYKGGICVDKAICGYWIIKPYSQFAFLSFVGDHLRYFGTGTWTLLPGSIIQFRFADNQLHMLNNSEMQYSALSKPPFDSIYINGSIKKSDNSPVSFASVIINNSYNTVSDAKGYFSIVLPATLRPDTLLVLNKRDGFTPVQFILNSNNNYHSINLTLQTADTLSAGLVYTSHPKEAGLLPDPQIKLKYVSSGAKQGYSTIMPTTETANTLILRLSKAGKNQPMLKATINQLSTWVKQ
jgi:hypothetical protein